jgi:hypothetical protein
MLAGIEPPDHDDRAENLGRALIGIASLAVLLLPLVGRASPRAGRPYEFAFLRLAIVVFGPVAAVPRLWLDRVQSGRRRQLPWRRRDPDPQHRPRTSAPPATLLAARAYMSHARVRRRAT